jgi:uncharacterized membrane-anchored protein YitT (DUF2179 family)
MNGHKKNRHQTAKLGRKMIPFWSQVIYYTVLRNKRHKGVPPPHVSEYMMAKAFREFRITIIKFVRDILLTSLGIFSAAFGLKSFLVPNKFIDGGATGISLLLSELTPLTLPVLLILINLPFMLLGIRIMGRMFALKTSLAIAGLAVVVATVHFPEITHDKLLVAVFGGFFLGSGIGLAVRSGCVIDGTEILALYLSRRLGTTMGDIITLINVVIFSSAAYFLSVDTALYSMVTYLAASRTVDFIIEGIEEYTGITIISSHSAELRKMIIEKLGRGITVYSGKQGFGKTGHTRDVDILYTVVTRLEINKLRSEIEKVDPNAFVVMNSLKDIQGGLVKKRRHKAG